MDIIQNTIDTSIITNKELNLVTSIKNKSLGSAITDPSFNTGEGWTLEGPLISISGGELFADASAEIRIARANTGTKIKAGNKYLVKVDADVGGTGNDWAAGFQVGGGMPDSPYHQVTGQMHNIVKQQILSVWKNGVIITANEDDNTLFFVAGTLGLPLFGIPSAIVRSFKVHSTIPHIITSTTQIDIIKNKE